MVTIIYKIVTAKLWQDAMAVGSLQGAPVDLIDGYIHLSTFKQVRETARKHFCGQSALILVAVDEKLLGDALKYEQSRGGDLFPHLYGPLPMEAVLWAKPLPVDAAGVHLFPAEVPE
ncbi:DUF952 domain-containing protein [Alsobacter sp. R-9]